MMPCNKRNRLALCGLLTLCLCILTGCATPPPADDPEAVQAFNEINDPLEPTNRVIFDANDAVYRNVLHPVAIGYRDVVPDVGRQIVANTLANLKSPTILFNDLLQANFTRAGQSLYRLVLNTTFGVGGLMDVATPLGIPRHDADFGETLAVWGVGPGPYLVLPLFGGSNPRDAGGLLVDSFADPLDEYLQSSGLTWVAEIRFGVSVVSLLDANLDAIDDIKRSSLDYYAAMRSLTRQRRAAQINDANSPTVGFVHFMPHIQWNLQNIF
jgi:phospholipid-binding lipoprotein MlaA